ncbi:MAG: bifunctional demethylmenaquinone methyltransferase/2-methoxy-6-polyprenyl-1,4-benzoquinol methylase UbiE [Sulfurovum sp.]|nr:bifunctional demethylmenaquinone methyltransferase/2-methoxy-6-polyprenyl-1,4-benzoquinol methylase UbiE [Sulfurovum sp.]MCB4745927.1 bifunctional demethylmenaquinone methyltransferase/2-methoxy-6-polyprenyl-1,4-benzoquinol methylase UbiE [Sulfurovum sp.]MCB4748994.1 bifunctional demethylmenaquinone methyltransferase/2-methoxy-6-polyprenyl-1,4-benzoquinol methylase UbiE [Sulfurovum sp.]MCB4749837.1 bifunctional demethylmenaquinone methyltransferase/2-methoxy-6-polyprenyl-1,4-benzoquinol methy
MGIEKLTNKEKKQEKIVEMFDDIASTYDKANRVLSMGIDIQWRKKGCDKAFEILDKKQLGQVTDVATGTGDLLIYWREQAQKSGVVIEKYVGIDPSVGMLGVAKEKVDFAEFVVGKAQELPVEDESSDVVSISYGIRNVVDRVEALQEFNRVLKSGGLVVILEFTKQERRGFVNKMVDFGMKNILPRIGGFISKNYEAYKYLPDSIEEFLSTEMLSKELEEAGFEMKYIKSFSMGISTLLIAQKR